MAKKLILKKIRKTISEYLSTNRLFLSYVILSLIGTILIRHFTLGNNDYRPIIVDLAFILLIGSLGYLVSPRKQFAYFFIWLIIFTAINIINSIYYTWYLTFVSFGLIASISQVGEVTDSLVAKFQIIDFVYLTFPLIFYYIHRVLNKTNYYNYVSKVERGKKMCIGTSLFGVILIALTMVTMSSQDYSRITKQWNRQYIVERFGIILYQGNDLIQSLTPKINSLFGYDEAARTFREFYTNNADESKTNAYTDILKDKNIIFIHMESIQSFLMDLEFNGIETTPTINKLAEEGLFFNNFYPQISTGTSSDTEFSLLTSLMPALSGTVAVSYYNREYVSIPKLLRDQGYYIFSMHGNKADMWNRANLHKSLGYDKFYSQNSYVTTKENTIGLGISDSSFFEQSLRLIEEIEKEHDKYMGTLITLSNHSPFDDLDKYGEYDLGFTMARYNEKTGLTEEVRDEFLNNRKLGNYIKSSHYADLSLGEFIDYVKSSEYFNDTVFVFYGDHDAKISKSEYNFFYNYDKNTGQLRNENDPNYYNYDTYQHDLNRGTPLIIWSSDPKVNKDLRKSKYMKDNAINYPIGMYDILPTIGNMMGFSSPYALGHDIFNVKDDNIVIFPNGNFLTSKVYYNNTSEQYYSFKDAIIDELYIEECKKYTEDRLIVSNNIIVHDLIKKESNKANYSEVSE